MKNKHPSKSSRLHAWEFFTKGWLRKTLSGLVGAAALAVAGVMGVDAWVWLKTDIELHHYNAVSGPVVRTMVTNLQAQVQDLRLQFECESNTFNEFTNHERWRWYAQGRTNGMLFEETLRLDRTKRSR